MNTGLPAGDYIASIFEAKTNSTATEIGMKIQEQGKQLQLYRDAMAFGFLSNPIFQQLKFKPEEQQMKTNYTGCNQEIAASLKKGEHIKVNVTHPNGAIIGSDTIHAYCVEELYPYIGKEDDYSNESCKPIPKTETRVIGHVAMMQGLLDRGYTPKLNGEWTKHSIINPVISKSIFSRCGERLGNTCILNWMTEEVKI